MVLLNFDVYMWEVCLKEWEHFNSNNPEDDRVNCWTSKAAIASRFPSCLKVLMSGWVLITRLGFLTDVGAAKTRLPVGRRRTTGNVRRSKGGQRKPWRRRENSQEDEERQRRQAKWPLTDHWRGLRNNQCLSKSLRCSQHVWYKHTKMFYTCDQMSYVPF